MAAVSIAACQPAELEEQVKVFNSLSQCEGYYAKSVCEAQHSKAKLADKNAPKFESKQDCDAEYGKCETRSGGGFYPIMNGFVAPGSHMSSIQPQPLYGNGKTMGGSYVYDGAKVTPSSMTTPKTSVSVPRGGFGARGASISSGG